MELANKHHLGRKLRRSWLVSYVNFFNSTVHNFRTKLYHFPNEHQRMEFASRISRARFPSGISAALQFADKHSFRRKA